MRKSGMTRREALQLITPIVDGEASKRQQELFFKYLETDPDVKRQYKSEYKIKKMMQERCPRYSAPSKLKERIHHLLDKQPDEISRLTASTNRLDLTEMMCALSDTPARCEPQQQEDETVPFVSTHDKRSRLYTSLSVAAGIAVIIALAVTTHFFKFGLGTESFNLDEYVYRHFNINKAGFVLPTLSTGDASMAEEYVRQQYEHKLKVPRLNGTELRGVVTTEFVPGYQTPMLEYYHAGHNSYIYVFTFNINQLDAFDRLERYGQAVQSCNSDNDYYVHEVKNTHIVSWKWDSTWYAAISTMNGHHLASLVPQLRNMAEK